MLQLSDILAYMANQNNSTMAQFPDFETLSFHISFSPTGIAPMIMLI